MFPDVVDRFDMVSSEHALAVAGVMEVWGVVDIQVREHP